MASRIVRVDFTVPAGAGAYATERFHPFCDESTGYANLRCTVGVPQRLFDVAGSVIEYWMPTKPRPTSSSDYVLAASGIAGPLEIRVKSGGTSGTLTLLIPVHDDVYAVSADRPGPLQGESVPAYLTDLTQVTFTVPGTLGQYAPETQTYGPGLSTGTLAWVTSVAGAVLELWVAIPRSSGAPPVAGDYVLWETSITVPGSIPYLAMSGFYAQLRVKSGGTGGTAVLQMQARSGKPGAVMLLSVRPGAKLETMSYAVPVTLNQYAPEAIDWQPAGWESEWIGNPGMVVEQLPAGATVEVDVGAVHGALDYLTVYTATTTGGLQVPNVRGGRVRIRVKSGGTSGTAIVHLAGSPLS